MKKSTMTDLVEELKKLPQTPEIEFMITEAAAGEYHDFKNNKYACGKVESSTRLAKLGHHDLAHRIQSGEFDEEADEADVAELKKIAPPAMHGVLGLTDKPPAMSAADEELAKKYGMKLHRQRVQANSLLTQLHSQLQPGDSLQDCLIEMEMFATHMMALCFTNYVKHGHNLKDVLERSRKKLMQEIDYIAEHSVELRK